MHDGVLARIRETFHVRHPHPPWGAVEQVRRAGRLFAGDYSSGTTAGEEFGGSLIGLGVMHDLDGEIISVRGFTWRVPVDGVPVEVRPDEGIAFGVAAHGGRQHSFDLPAGVDLNGILAAVDGYLVDTHVDHEQVVCAIEIVGDFTDVLLRTVAPPTHEGETLGEIIEDEIRFAFDTWHGTLVGFRFPDETEGQTIPSLHLHGISSDATSGGHVRQVMTGRVRASIWVDELHPIHDAPVVDVTGKQGQDDVSIDFARYEGPVRD